MSPLKGIGLKLLSAFLFAVMSALVRQLGDVAPVGQMVFFRSAFAIPPVLAIYALRGELMSAVRTRREPSGNTNPTVPIKPSWQAIVARQFSSQRRPGMVSSSNTHTYSVSNCMQKKKRGHTPRLCVEDTTGTWVWGGASGPSCQTTI